MTVSRVAQQTRNAVALLLFVFFCSSQAFMWLVSQVNLKLRDDSPGITWGLIALLGRRWPLSCGLGE